MTLRLSTGARNAIAARGGFAGAFNKCTIAIYSGSQPTTADAAATGTLLGRITVSSGALTAETRASGTITITGGSGTITAVTVGTFNIIPDDATLTYDTSTTVTAANLAKVINRNGIYEATSSAAVVTIKPRPGVGAAHNTYAVSSTGTCTATYANMSGGVAAVNALHFDEPASGVVAKPSTQVWSMSGVAAGTAGWFRIYASETDAGSLITAAPYLARVDGSVATSGADLNLSNITIAIGAPTTVDSFSFTMPAQ